VGSLIIGTLGDLLKYKRTLLFVCASAALLSMLSLIFIHLNVLSLIIVFFCLGFFTSSQVMAYPHAAKQIEPAFQALATSIVSTCMLGSTAIMQPLFAWLLEIGDDSKHPIVYHYNYALCALAVCLGISVLLSFAIDIHNKKHV
jgi:MFS family permease